jgi:hypothetical protein
MPRPTGPDPRTPIDRICLTRVNLFGNGFGRVEGGRQWRKPSSSRLVTGLSPIESSRDSRLKTGGADVFAGATTSDGSRPPCGAQASGATPCAKRSRAYRPEEEVFSASGPSAAMHTSPQTRPSVLAAVMSAPPQEWLTRTKRLVARDIQRSRSMSPWWLREPCWLARTSCPSGRSGGISLLKHEPSTETPWAMTTLLLEGIIRSSQSPGLVLSTGTVSKTDSDRQNRGTGTTRSRGFF